MPAQQQFNPELYGIKHSNRDLKEKEFWGKNQFNSEFPAALCCYMRDNGYGCMLMSQVNGAVQVAESTIEHVFGTALPNDQLKFCFEAAYDPYKQYVDDDMEIIDLVIMNAATGAFVRPLEIKLTTLPDTTTCDLTDDKYGSEIVVRSATMRYIALGLASRCSTADKARIKAIFDQACIGIQDWNNRVEMISRRDDIFVAVDKFLNEFEGHQQPLVVQPLWKTEKKDPRLAENCLDVFVWTDIALTRVIYGQAKNWRRNNISRHQRAVLRLARFLWEFAKSGRVYQKPIYDGMTYDAQNDKEFSLSGIITHRYMACDRLTKPKVTKDEVKKIVLGGGQKFLSPERRFDAILYFSMDLFEDGNGNN